MPIYNCNIQICLFEIKDRNNLEIGFGLISNKMVCHVIFTTNNPNHRQDQGGLGNVADFAISERHLMTTNEVKKNFVKRIYLLKIS